MVRLYLYSLLILAFFIGGIVDLGIVPNWVSWSIELIIVLLLLKVLGQKVVTRERFILFGVGFVIMFVFVCLISALLNDTSALLTLLFARQCLRFHFLLWILLNLNLTEASMVKIHKLLVFLFIIQIPTAIIKSFLYGQGEKAIGTYAMFGGGNSTAIPMVAISFIVCYYFLYRPHKYFWILALGFLAFGIVGEKSAIVIFIPVIVIFAALTCIRYKHSIALFSKSIRVVMYVLCVTVPIIFYCGVRLVPKLNPDKEIGGRFSFEHAISFIRRYNRGVTGEDLSYGRIETSLRIYRCLRERGLETLLFGLGPGDFVESSFAGHDKAHFKEQLSTVGVCYGISTLNFLALQVGYIGATIWIAFLAYATLMLNRFARRETDPYWQAYVKSMECVSWVAIFISLTYNNVFLVDDSMGMTYMMLLAFAIRRCTLRQQCSREHRFWNGNPQPSICNLRHYDRMIPDATPEKFSMIGSVS